MSYFCMSIMEVRTRYFTLGISMMMNRDIICPQSLFCPLLVGLDCIILQPRCVT